MGTHPSNPSIVKNSSKPLSEVLASNPALIGERVGQKFGRGQLPFLFKILSIHKALSIQAHPDKKLAEQLHARDPQNYKGINQPRHELIADDNHKPEMTIALTPFTGFCGFRPLNEISHFLATVPELASLLGPSAKHFQDSFAKSPADGKQALRDLFTALMNSKPDDIAAQAELLVDRAKNKGTFGDDEGLASLFVELDLQFPKDVGLFCTFFLNYVTLRPGEAMFLRANDVHAYISGGTLPSHPLPLPFRSHWMLIGVDVVECMAASDNVVRAGLTPKYKDIQTLTTMLTYNSAPADEQKMKPLKFKNCRYSTLYDPPIEEFSVVRTELDGREEEMEGIDGPSLIIATSGYGTLASKMEDYELKEGSVWFIGAGEKIVLKGNGKLVTHRAFVEV